MIARRRHTTPTITPEPKESATMAPSHLRLNLVLALSAVAVVLAAFAPAAQAGFGVTEFDGVLTADESGAPQVQAGGHPYDYTTTIKFNTMPGQLDPTTTTSDEQVKSTVVSLPPGLIGNVNATPTCSESDLATVDFSGGNCPANSQVGYVIIRSPAVYQSFQLGVYNQKPSPGSVATLGFNAPNGWGTTHLQAHLRTGGDYGVNIEASDIPQFLPIISVKLVIWGTPAAESHSKFRDRGFGCFGVEPGDPFQICPRPGGQPSTAPLRPFLTMPTACEGPTTTTLRANSWEHPAVFEEAAFVSHDGEGNTVSPSGCDEVPFDPTFTFKPGSRGAGEPSSYSADLHLPYLDNPGGVAEGTIRDIRIEFPKGVTVSTASVEGLGSCGPAQVDLSGPDSAKCPSDSKIGSVEIDTPLVDHPLPGALYLASQGTNPFNSLLALYLTIDDPQTGIAVKLAGKVSPDPQTGQLIVSFEDNPQLPFEDMHLELKGGPRAPLVNPNVCGTYFTHAELTPWARPDEAVSSDSSFVIDRNCGNESRFTPGFQAGTTNPIAGSHSPFTLRVTRPNAQQNVSRVEATLPEGLLAKLAGVPLCADSDAATGNCPSGSQIGSATVGTGAGSNPLYVPQPGKAPTAVYLAGPHNGAPYSLVVKVPAQAGPFDLGTVTVRNAISVDPTTAQVSVKSDPLPQILQGIPIAYRDIRVAVDREGFTLNPTSCDPMQVTGALTSSGGLLAGVSDRFQAANCERLKFRPKLAISLSGQVKRTGNPALKAVLTQPKGQANIGKTTVVLPKGQLIDNAHINNPCTRDQFAAGACPKGSILGRARAFSPLLDEPLEGPVYFRSNGGVRELPDIVADLHGQIHVELVGFIDAVKSGSTSRVRTRFQNVPDAPVSKFVLQMKGGKKGLLENSVNLCRSNPRAEVKMDGQNGKVHDFAVRVKRSCGK